jgi:hypothetical protein
MTVMNGRPSRELIIVSDFVRWHGFTDVVVES